MTKEIPQNFWQPFCDRVKDGYRGAVTIRWVNPDGATQVIAENAPLQKLVFQQRNNECSDTMTVETGTPDERPHAHEIIEPFSIILKKNGESGRYNELDILAETGKTEIYFSPGLDAAILPELAA
ncbi:MAG TPA: DUF5335 family protein [Pseudomonadales bacterium]|nr:DUF5335 family protein [Pseudomonadales bacterium]